MIFADSRSALIRLSDCVKLGLDSCVEPATEVLKLYAEYEFIFRRAREVALKAERHQITDDVAENELKRIFSEVPMEVSVQAVQLQATLHSRALTTILTCCFLIESYANSFAYFVRTNDETAEETKRMLEGSFGRGEKTRTIDKWAILGAIGGKCFDKARSPFQDLVILFRFRDDLVHDKPVPWGVGRANARYSGRLADPVLGLLNLKHALFAVELYWALVAELHSISGVSADAFHGHYNLRPWFEQEHLQKLRLLAKRYEESGVQRR